MSNILASQDGFLHLHCFKKYIGIGCGNKKKKKPWWQSQLFLRWDKVHWLNQYTFIYLSNVGWNFQTTLIYTLYDDKII